ncbi:MAG: outer membrane beta-barrel protein [Candidatus Marinimicrobia bacterium]|nr:outer membrane beta-barrel protein [Candidatus Neomarinimicrobiota bacterium]
MKKLTIVLMSVLLASFAFAQFDLGLKLGANYSYIESEELDPQVYLDQFSNLENITGIVGGAFAVIGFGNFGIQLEGLFSVEGFSPEALLSEDPGTVLDGVSITTNYLNAVVMARYNIDLAVVAPFVGAGINLGLPLGTEVEGMEIDLEDFDFTNIGLAFAAGVKVLDMVDVELRYVKGLTDISTQETSDDVTTFSNLVRLSLGLYIF